MRSTLVVVYEKLELIIAHAIIKTKMKLESQVGKEIDPGSERNGDGIYSQHAPS